MNKIKVLLADDSEIFVEGLKAFFQRDPTIEIVCVTGIGQETVDKTIKYKPNLVLADIDLSRHNELELIKTIHRELPAVRIIIFTRGELEDDLYSAILAGVTGCVRKTVSFDKLTKLITLAMEDNVAIFTSSFENLVKTAGVTGKTFSIGSPEYAALSTREGQVLTLVARGSSNADVASVLFISENTVKVHMRNIMEKLKVKNRQQAATLAVARGLLTRLS